MSLLHMFAGSAHWSAGYLAAGVLADYLQRGPGDDCLPPMPPPLVDLLKHCFRSNPEDRPRDMLEIIAGLQRLYAQAIGRGYRRAAPQAAKARADALNNRALSLRDLNKHDEAEQLWHEALTISPQHPESTYNLGLTHWRAGRSNSETLRQQLHDVCLAHAGEWLPPYLLARMQLEEGDWRSALEMLERVPQSGAELDEVRAAREAAEECLSDSGRPVRRFTGHTGWVSSVCAGRNGRSALSGSADGTLKLWSAASGRCLRTLVGHAEWVTSVGLSGDGRIALSGSADRTLRLVADARRPMSSCPGRTPQLGVGGGFERRWPHGAVGRRRWHRQTVGHSDGRLSAYARWPRRPRPRRVLERRWPTRSVRQPRPAASALGSRRRTTLTRLHRPYRQGAGRGAERRWPLRFVGRRRSHPAHLGHVHRPLSACLGRTSGRRNLGVLQRRRRLCSFRQRGSHHQDLAAPHRPLSPHSGRTCGNGTLALPTSPERQRRGQPAGVVGQRGCHAGLVDRARRAVGALRPVARAAQ